MKGYHWTLSALGSGLDFAFVLPKFDVQNGIAMPRWRKWFICTVLICTGMHLLAQEAFKPRYLLVKTNVTQMVDLFTFPSVGLCVEAMVSPRFSVSAEASYQIYSLRKEDSTFFPQKGYKASAEVRMYFKRLQKREGAPEGLYVGIQPFFRQNQYSASISYVHAPHDTLTDGLGVRKTCYGVNLLGGYQLRFLSKCVLDAYLGIGAMNRNVENVHKEFDASAGDKLFGYDLVPFFAQRHLSDYAGPSLNLQLGVRIGVYLVKE